VYKPKRDPAVETTTLPDGQAVIVLTKTEWAHTLSPLGAIVWEFCDGTNSVDEIVSLVTNLPGIPQRPELAKEIALLIETMEQEGVVSSQE
jgi:Coenzyme PQQ synthesis protein D (PqqD)